MPRIWYQTPDASAQSLTATSLTAALLRLRAQQVVPLSIREEGAPTPGAMPRRWSELTPVYEQLGNLLAKGVSVSEALGVLAGQSSRPRVRYSLQRLAKEVAEGRPLHEAMALQPQTYSELVVNAVAAGEAADELGETFSELGQQQRRIAQITTRLLPLIIYPLFICWIITADLTFLSTFIIPKFVNLYRELGMTNDHLPYLTRALLPLMRVVPSFLWALILVVIAVYGLGRIYDNLLRGRLQVQMLWLKVPLLGRLTYELSLARASSTLAMLLRRRVSPPQALRLAGKAADNAVIDFAFRRAAGPAAEGASLGAALQTTDLLPPEFVQEVAAAEAAGDLPEAMTRASEGYWERTLYRARTQPYIVAPLIILGLGILVGLVAMGIFMPLIAIIGQLSG